VGGEHGNIIVGRGIGEYGASHSGSMTLCSITASDEGV
jgi:hypothetical protein